MNSVVLLGRATSAIELTQTQQGKSKVRFQLAVRRPYTKDTTDFITVIAWENQAELLSKYVGKGDRVCVGGYISTRTWDDKQGNKRYETEVVASVVSLCEAKKTSEGNYTAQNSNTPQSTVGASQTIVPNFEDVGDEDLPF